MRTLVGLRLKAECFDSALNAFGSILSGFIYGFIAGFMSGFISGFIAGLISNFSADFTPFLVHFLLSVHFYVFWDVGHNFGLSPGGANVLWCRWPPTPHQSRPRNKSKK